VRESTFSVHHRESARTCCRDSLPPLLSTSLVDDSLDILGDRNADVETAFISFWPPSFSQSSVMAAGQVQKDFESCLPNTWNRVPLPQTGINDRPGLVGLGMVSMTQNSGGRSSRISWHRSRSNTGFPWSHFACITSVMVWKIGFGES
jgi:hypothetical protein